LSRRSPRRLVTAKCGARSREGVSNPRNWRHIYMCAPWRGDRQYGQATICRPLRGLTVHICGTGTRGLRPGLIIYRPLRGLFFFSSSSSLGLTPQAQHLSPLRGSGFECLPRRSLPGEVAPFGGSGGDKPRPYIEPEEPPVRQHTCRPFVDRPLRGSGGVRLRLRLRRDK
jgi:hypothetical protein